MNRISRLKERLESRRWRKNDPTAPSSKKASSPRGVILGMRSESRLTDASGRDLDLEVEETVLSCLVEDPRTDLLFPISALSRRMLPENQPILKEVLKKMESNGVIKIIATNEGEIGVKLTLEGAMRTLYGDWYPVYTPELTPIRNGGRKRQIPTPMAHQIPSKQV